ncbi:cell division protein FtsK [Salibacterium salarium]|uniref:Cell division protein FtsK n=1 Tax=Salibacterium salarium TaxID=284579 RepID=A0A3R9QME6_9BACI|nr:FtsK/SpoIIIE domain-containing protein [Salibacterium salarium]RSL29057.1 cell division protein FtsK [Salibacterium salarium]
MIIELGSTLIMGGVAAFAQTKGSGGLSLSDHEKIRRIFANCNLVVREGGQTKTIRIHARRRIKDGMEYVYQLPLGLSYERVRECLPVIQDGLNTKQTLDVVDFEALRDLRLDRTILRQLQALIRRERHRKEVTADFDGMLRLRVHNRPLTEFYEYDDELLAKCNGWQVPVGMARDGLLWNDFEKYPHIIVAGATDKGKSVFLKNVITTIIGNKPTDASFTLIDLKDGMGFARFQDCTQVFGDVAKDPTEAVEALRKVKQYVTAKNEKHRGNGYEDVKEAGDPARHFVIIDEAAELSSAGETDKETKKALVEAESLIKYIGRCGRSAGVRLVYATQYPTNETLPSQVRQNISARVCFKLETNRASLAALDESGAEDLPATKGRAIYRNADGKTIVQTPYIDNQYIAEKITPHVNIRARNNQTEGERANGGSSDQRNSAARTGGTHTIQFEETRLS